MIKNETAKRVAQCYLSELNRTMMNLSRIFIIRYVNVNKWTEKNTTETRRRVLSDVERRMKLQSSLGNGDINNPKTTVTESHCRLSKYVRGLALVAGLGAILGGPLAVFIEDKHTGYLA